MADVDPKRRVAAEIQAAARALTSRHPGWVFVVVGLDSEPEADGGRALAVGAPESMDTQAIIALLEIAAESCSARAQADSADPMMKM